VKLWLTNFSPQVTDDELRAVMHECEKLEVITRLTREVGDDLQPGAVLAFDEPGRETLCETQRQRRLSEPSRKTHAVAGHAPI
jgi:hypothetical protein